MQLALTILRNSNIRFNKSISRFAPILRILPVFMLESPVPQGQNLGAGFEQASKRTSRGAYASIYSRGSNMKRVRFKSALIVAIVGLVCGTSTSAHAQFVATLGYGPGFAYRPTIVAPPVVVTQPYVAYSSPYAYGGYGGYGYGGLGYGYGGYGYGGLGYGGGYGYGGLGYPGYGYGYGLGYGTRNHYNYGLFGHLNYHYHNHGLGYGHHHGHYRW